MWLWCICSFPCRGIIFHCYTITKKKSLDGCGLLVLLQYLNSIPCNLNYVIISASRPLHSSYWCFLHDTLSLIRKWTNLEMCRRKQVNF